MRTLIAAIAATSLTAFAAHAQAPAVPAQSAPQNAAVKDPSANNASRPVAGANSFTQDQAKSRIEARGYSQVTGLQKDANGVWRGHAMRDGRSVAVSVDYQGNVN